MTTAKEEFKRCWQEGINTCGELFWIEVKMEGFLRTEKIVNHHDNAQKKLEYYDKTYDDDLAHNAAGTAIQIVDWGFQYNTTINFGY